MLWTLAIVVLHPLAGSLYQVTDDTAAAILSASAPSTLVATIQQHALQASLQASTRRSHSDDLAVVFTHTSGLTTSGLAAVVAARAAVSRLVGRSSGLGSPSPVRRAPTVRPPCSLRR